MRIVLVFLKTIEFKKFILNLQYIEYSIEKY